MDLVPEDSPGGAAADGDAGARCRVSAVSVKEHERFLFDALQAAREDKRARVFQETDAGCARVAISPQSLVIEYYGEYLRNKMADIKQERYERRRIADYMFRVGEDMILDATFKGGRARFINHSCDPNCIARIIKYPRGENRIFIISKRAIHPGDEVTYDYQFDIEEEKIPCLCGAPNCRGTLN
eukprot:g3528.t1